VHESLERCKERWAPQKQPLMVRQSEPQARVALPFVPVRATSSDRISRQQVMLEALDVRLAPKHRHKGSFVAFTPSGMRNEKIGVKRQMPDA
jgi:hypothetical protein